MEKETREKLYKISEVAELLGVHEDTLRNWEKEGLIKPERIGTRGDRRYTAEMIGEIKKKGLVSDLAKKTPTQKKDLDEYTKDELIKELQILKKQKKYGLVWEDHTEEVVERCKTEAPILVAKKDRQIKDKDKNKPTNILIEGDNYHALQVLNYTHKGKIDVIYIDPPYNTKNNGFIYNDKIVDGNDAYRHSKWVSMMEKRLLLAKNLMATSASIFVSIDNNELYQLKLLMDGIFGEENFVANLSIENNPKGRKNSNYISISHEHALVYTKNKECTDGFFVENIPKDESGLLVDNFGRKYTSGKRVLVGSSSNNKVVDFESEKNYVVYYNEKKNDIKITKEDLQNTNKELLKSGYKRYVSSKEDFLIENTYTKNKFLELFKKNGLIFNKESIYEKDFNIFIRMKSILKNTPDIDLKTETAGTALRNMGIEFPNPKNLGFIKILLTLFEKKDLIILDFFSGSGTTGHAVLDLNKEYGGNRKFILCTNNELNGLEKELKEKGLDKEEIEEYGICRRITHKRIEKVMTGYTKPDGEKIKGFGGSLEYFKTEFVDVENIENVSDKKKLEFTYEAGQMIALKEDAFKEIAKNKFYQIFTDEKDKFIGIYFRENLDKLSEMEKKILDKKDVKLYLFSYGVNDFKKDYTEYKNVTVKDIPEPILKIYKRLNN